MKCIHKFLLLILIFVSIEIKAQDWQCARAGVAATFVDTAELNTYYTANTMWAVNIDSVGIYQGWKYHNGFHKFRILSITYNGPYDDICADGRGASRMGVAMSALEGENFFFNSAGDGIRISTLRQPGEPWICCRINDSTHLYATVESVGVEEVLGETDSVKYISFQAKRIAGDPVAHPLNSQLFKLSKHFGMLTLYDFYYFPDYSVDYPLFVPVHLLAGISEPGHKTGSQNITQRDIFSFAPDDEFHTFKVENKNNHFNGVETKVVSRVLDSVWNSTGDTVTYLIKWCKNYWIGYPDQPHHYSEGIDTISYAVFSNDCIGLDYFPEQAIRCYEASGALKSIHSFSQIKNATYNSRWIKYEQGPFTPVSYCADSLVGLKETYHPYASIIPVGYYYYIEGCGGPYYGGGTYDPVSHSSSSFSKSLVYFKKGSETWGTSLDTTNWEDLYAIPDTFHVRLILYPNPSNDLVTLEIPDLEKPDYRLEIFSLSGIKISEMNFTDSKFIFSISDYRQGMYFLKLYNGNLQLGQEKLIKN